MMKKSKVRVFDVKPNGKIKKSKPKSGLERQTKYRKKMMRNGKYQISVFIPKKIRDAIHKLAKKEKKLFSQWVESALLVVLSKETSVTNNVISDKKSVKSGLKADTASGSRRPSDQAKVQDKKK